MVEKDVVDIEHSGLLYYKCPLCGLPFSHSDISLKGIRYNGGCLVPDLTTAYSHCIFTCDKCNMQFQGDKKGEDTDILVYEHTDIPLLMATKLEYTKSYVLKQWCNGKKV